MTAKQKRTFSITGIATLILGGLIAWAVFTFTDFTAGRFVRPNTPAPSADAAARQFEGRTDLINPDYQDKLASAAIAKAEREGYVPAGIPDLNGGFTEAKGPVPELEAKAVNEWTFQTNKGPLAIAYRETEWTRGKLLVSRSGAKVLAENKSEAWVYYVAHTDLGDKWEGRISPGGTDVLVDLTNMEGATIPKNRRAEIWLEAGNKR